MSPGPVDTPGAAPGRCRLLRSAALAAAPLVLLAAWVALLRARGPAWLGSNSDPAYPYLLNGLNLATGHVPAHVDHPGTPVQLLVAVVLRAAHLVAGRGALADDVVARPERYLAIAGWVLMVLAAGALALAGRAAWRATGSTVAGLAAGLLPGLMPVVAAHVVHVKPEPVLVALGALLAVRTLRTLEPGPAQRPASDAAAFGVLVGLAVACKVSSAPLAALPLLLLRGRALRLRFAAVAAGTAALATLPAWPAMGHFRQFLLGIATHAGQYGSGRPTLLDRGEYLAGLRALATDAAGALTLAIMAAGGLVALALARRARRQGEGAAARVRDALAAVIAAQAASFLLVARHAAAHYLLPALVLSGLTAALAVHGAGLLAGPRPAARRAVAAAAACALALAGLRMAGGLREARTGMAASQAVQLEVAEALAARFPGARVLHHYRSSSQAYALHFGDMFARSRWSGRIEARYPRSLYYNLWNRKLEVYDPDPARPERRPLEFRDLTPEVLCGIGGEGPVVVQGRPFPPGPATAADPLGGRIRAVFSTPLEVLSLPAGCPEGE